MGAHPPRGAGSGPRGAERRVSASPTRRGLAALRALVSALRPHRFLRPAEADGHGTSAPPAEASSRPQTPRRALGALDAVPVPLAACALGFPPDPPPGRGSVFSRVPARLRRALWFSGSQRHSQSALGTVGRELGVGSDEMRTTPVLVLSPGVSGAPVRPGPASGGDKLRSGAGSLAGAAGRGRLRRLPGSRPLRADTHPLQTLCLEKCTWSPNFAPSFRLQP